MLNGRGVRLGVLDGSTDETGKPLVQILIWNEFGTRHIPARPVMSSFIDRNTFALGAEAEKAARFVFRTGNVGIALRKLGEYAEAGLKDHWRASRTWAVPNSEFTIKRKGSDVPLINHGVLLGAIRYEMI